MPLFVGSIPDVHARQGAFDYGSNHGAMDAVANTFKPANATLEIPRKCILSTLLCLYALGQCQRRSRRSPHMMGDLRHCSREQNSHSVVLDHELHPVSTEVLRGKSRCMEIKKKLKAQEGRLTLKHLQ